MIATLFASLLLATPPNWDVGNSFAKDVCTERDLRSDRSCYIAYLRQVERDRRRLCTWSITRLSDLPEFQRWNESREDRLVRAAIEQRNSCH